MTIYFRGRLNDEHSSESTEATIAATNFLLTIITPTPTYPYKPTINLISQTSAITDRWNTTLVVRQMNEEIFEANTRRNEINLP